MKIAVIGSKGLPPGQGGIEHHCAEVYPRIVEQGHLVDLYARSSYTSEFGGSTINFKGVKTISLSSLRLRGIDAFSNAVIAAILASQRTYDVVHFHALGPALFTPIPKLASTAKTVVTCHGLDWKRAKWGKFSSRIIKAGEQTAIKYADAFTVVSESLQDYFAETYNYATNYIGNAPVAFSDSNPNAPYVHSLGLIPKQYIVFVGRLVPEKCPDLLIKAFNALQAPNLKLVFVGGTSDTSDYTTELLGQAQANSNILFTGELEGARLAEMVRNAGLFVLPSNVEGLPLALLEAMQEKIPVIVSNIPVHQQIVGKDRGLIFARGNAESCMQCLSWAIHNPGIMAEFAAKASRYVRLNHNWDDIALSYLKLYKCLLNPDLNMTRHAIVSSNVN